MTDDPLLSLLIESLSRMHPRFAAGNGIAYDREESLGARAAKKEREQSYIREFYHQFRLLWDKALPVKLGLGHVVVQADPLSPPGRQPDLLLWRLGENGQPDARLAAISLALISNADALEADQSLLNRYRNELGYQYAVSVRIGTESEELDNTISSQAGIAYIFYETQKRVARVLANPR